VCTDGVVKDLLADNARLAETAGHEDRPMSGGGDDGGSSAFVGFLHFLLGVIVASCGGAGALYAYDTGKLDLWCFRRRHKVHALLLFTCSPTHVYTMLFSHTHQGDRVPATPLEYDGDDDAGIDFDDEQALDDAAV
jgi:hypothetical protein